MVNPFESFDEIHIDKIFSCITGEGLMIRLISSNRLEVDLPCTSKMLPNRNWFAEKSLLYNQDSIASVSSIPMSTSRFDFLVEGTYFVGDELIEGSSKVPSIVDLPQNAVNWEDNDQMKCVVRRYKRVTATYIQFGIILKKAAIRESNKEQISPFLWWDQYRTTNFNLLAPWN